MTFEFDKKKLDAAVRSIESMCYHCEKHSDECPIAVAIGELKQEYGKNKPKVDYHFKFDSKKTRKAIATIESMCYHCKEHTDECPIARAVNILGHYIK